MGKGGTVKNVGVIGSYLKGYRGVGGVVGEVGGFLGSDQLTIEPTLTVNGNTKEAGEYTITASGAGASENYSITYVSGKMTVRAHAWNDGTVTKAPTCAEKGEKTFTCEHNSAHTKIEEISASGHSHGTEWKQDTENHWNECACGDKANLAAHADGDGDGKCDTCEYAISIEIPGSEDPDPSEDNEELSGGAIAAIAVGSAAVLGLGGFSLIWFGIQKKSLLDLIGIFKK